MALAMARSAGVIPSQGPSGSVGAALGLPAGGKRDASVAAGSSAASSGTAKIASYSVLYLVHSMCTTWRRVLFIVFGFSATPSGSDHWESKRPPQFVHA